MCGNLFEILTNIVGTDNVLKDEPMSRHDTFKVGGPANFYVIPHSKEEVLALVKKLRELKEKFYIIGNGSNLIVKDEGYGGVIIQIWNNMESIKIEGQTITAGAGTMLGKIANAALENELAGFEFASGIPGTLGGAVVMNAGAYGGEMKGVLISATVIDDSGDVLTLTNEQLELDYRTSAVAKNGYIVLEAVIALKKGNKDEILALMKDYNGRRRDKQPLEYPSAGSTFKRPEGYFAGKLIQDAGLKGYTVGGAQVSMKHSGFVINRGGATCDDIIKLISDVTKIVEDKFGVTLETEVKIL